MKKTLLVLSTAAVLGVSAVAAPSPAEARWRGGGFGPGIAGGLIAGAVIGGIASSAYGYGPGYGYGYGYPGYRYYGGYTPAAYYGGYDPYPWGGYTTAYYKQRVRAGLLRASLSSCHSARVRLLRWSLCAPRRPPRSLASPPLVITAPQSLGSAPSAHAPSRASRGASSRNVPLVLGYSVVGSPDVTEVQGDPRNDCISSRLPATDTPVERASVVSCFI
ncbi:hypothetical protein ACVIQY_005179 [Bradyrhizobium sp. USDA 3051]